MAAGYGVIEAAGRPLPPSQGRYGGVRARVSSTCCRCSSATGGWVAHLEASWSFRMTDMTVFALFTRPAWSQAAIFAGQPLGSGPRKSPRNPGSSHHTPNSAKRERARRRGSRIWGQRRRPGGPRAPPPPRGSALQGPSPPQGVPGGPLGFSGPDGGCAPRKAIEPPHESLLGSRPRGGAVSSAGRRPSGPASTPRRSAGSQRSETCPTRGDSRAAPGDSGAAPGDSGAAPGDSGAAPGDSRAAPGGSRGRHRLRTRLASRRAESSSGDRPRLPASQRAGPGDAESRIPGRL